MDDFIWNRLLDIYAWYIFQLFEGTVGIRQANTSRQWVSTTATLLTCIYIKSLLSERSKNSSPVGNVNCFQLQTNVIGWIDEHSDGCFCRVWSVRKFGRFGSKVQRLRIRLYEIFPCISEGLIFILNGAPRPPCDPWLTMSWHAHWFPGSSSPPPQQNFWRSGHLHKD